MEAIGSTRGLLGLVARKAKEANPAADGDYIDEAGLCVCGKCHTRREKIINVNDFRSGEPTTMKVSVQCKCRQEAYDEEVARKKYREDMAVIEKLREMSLMDEKLRNATFSSYIVTPDNEKAFRASKRYVEKFREMYENGQGLLLHGPVGTGKSYTAAAIANELMSLKHSAVMTSFIKLLDGMSGFKSDDEKYIARLNRAELLVIDDLGAERSTDTTLEKVYNIIDSRYRSRKPLILTTNLTMAQIKKETDIRYVRIYDRIVEMCYPVKLDGKSWRKQEALSRFDAMRNLLEG